MAAAKKTTRRQLVSLLRKLASWGDCCELAAELHRQNVADKCDGTLAECFVAGWSNAATMIGDKQLDQNNWQSVRYYVFFDVANMHPDAER